MAKEEKSMEASFEELEAIIEKLEDNSSSLEESFKYYEAGMKLVKSCGSKLDKVEKKMIILAEEAGEQEQDS